MSATSYIFGVLLVQLCLISSLWAAGPSSSEEILVIPNENTIHEECLSTENMKQHMLNLKKMRDLELESLKQYFEGKDSNMKRSLNNLEEVIRDIEEAIENKINRLELRIMRQVRAYLDDKFEVLNTNTEKGNKYVSHKLKYISDMQDNVTVNIDKLQTKMRDVENMTIHLGSTLNTVQNTSDISSQKLDMLIIGMNESSDILNKTASYALQKYENITHDNCNITGGLNGLVNVTTQNTTEVETCQLDLLENKTNEYRDIVWSECEQEVVRDTHAIWYNYSKPLQSLADKALRHVSYCTASNHTEYLHMRVGVQACYRGDIVLSPEPEPKDTGFYFRIDLYHGDTYLGRAIAGVWKQLAHIYNGTPLTDGQPTAVLLTMFNDTLQLRHEHSSSPFFEHHDKRFGDIKYFGFASAFNDGHKSKFYYDC